MNYKSSQFHYGFDNQRRKTILSKPGSGNKTKYFFGNYEIHTNDTGEKSFLFVNSPVGLCAIIESYEENQVPVQKVWHTYTDHLGSLVYLENADNSSETLEYSYDCWGNPRKVNDWLDPNPIDGLIADRGFTGHEHLTEFGLINMNGRVYDPKLGRFLSPDPFVQAPHTVGGFNRYTYCFNNPLKYIDPSGYVPEYHLNGFDWAYASGQALFYQGSGPNRSGGRVGGAYQGIWRKMGAGGFVGGPTGVDYDNFVADRDAGYDGTFNEHYKSEGSGRLDQSLFADFLYYVNNFDVSLEWKFGKNWFVFNNKEFGQKVSLMSLNLTNLGANWNSIYELIGDATSGRGNNLAGGIGFANYLGMLAINRRLSNIVTSDGWYNQKGVFHSKTKLLSGVRNAHAYRYGYNAALERATKLKNAGRLMGAAGVGLTVINGYFNDGTWTAGDTFTTISSAIGIAFPIYGVADFVVGLTTGASISDRIGNAADNQNTSFGLTVKNFLKW